MQQRVQKPYTATHTSTTHYYANDMASEKCNIDEYEILGNENEIQTPRNHIGKQNIQDQTPRGKNRNAPQYLTKLNPIMQTKACQQDQLVGKSPKHTETNERTTLNKLTHKQEHTTKTKWEESNHILKKPNAARTKNAHKTNTDTAKRTKQHRTNLTKATKPQHTQQRSPTTH